MEIKTIDVNAKEWFDRINGNSYFSAQVCLNYGQRDHHKIWLGYQYGYGESYLDEAVKVLRELGYLPNESSPVLRLACEGAKIILRRHICRGCKKSEVKKFGEVG